MLSSPSMSGGHLHGFPRSREIIETKEVAGWHIKFLYKMSDNVRFCHALGAFLAVLSVSNAVPVYSVFVFNGLG